MFFDNYHNQAMILFFLKINETIFENIDYTITYKGTVYHGKITVVNQVNTGLCSNDATYDKFMKKCVCKNSNYTYDNENKKLIPV